jgi:histone demethylase JARID1
VDSGHHGSGFPLPLWRRRLLEQHLARAAAAAGGSTAAVELPGYADEEERHYAEHPWNINNMPRCASSVLRYLPGQGGELITGVMVPWLYVGSCLSAFCWHVEDHALCSVNYHHMGAPKVWYTVPARATAALEEAVRDALPHLVEANPRLLYQLVTALSPAELKVGRAACKRVWMGVCMS